MNEAYEIIPVVKILVPKLGTGACVVEIDGVGVAGRTGISSESPVLSTTIVFAPVDLDGGMTMIVLVNVDAPPGSSDDTKV